MRHKSSSGCGSWNGHSDDRRCESWCDDVQKIGYPWSFCLEAKVVKFIYQKCNNPRGN